VPHHRIRPFRIKPLPIGRITLEDLQALYANAAEDTRRRHEARVDAARFDRRPDTRLYQDEDTNG
jgi:hypothetical protein